MSHYKIKPLAFFLGFFVIALDALSKYYTQLTLPLMQASSHHYPYGGIGVFRNFLGIEFSITHATNKGAAWGMFADLHPYLVTLRVIFIIGLILYLVVYNTRPSWTLPLTLIIAGAIGNILDIAFYGHVIDMFHFILWGYDYPVFNVADSAIFIGAVWLVLSYKGKP